ncbi:AraC family transcriptional regulator [Paenibacillus sp. FSL H8-0548]|nr:AraC family transcriptional regulator [Paenibacillus sp. FSL H8-0548]
MLHFISPPMPHYTVSGEDTYSVGRKHPDRSNIGVFDLIVVTKGELIIEEANTVYQITANKYIILRPDLAHHTVAPCQEETHFYWLHFQTEGRWSESAEVNSFTQSQHDHPYAPIQTFSFYFPKFGEFFSVEQLWPLLEQLIELHQDDTPRAKWQQQMTFQELLLLLHEEGGITQKSQQFIIAEKAALYLRKYYKETLSYERLSKALHFHENYISLCMKKTLGCTPLEYLTRHRIEQAKQLLIRTNDPIGHIAEATGFGSFPYFVRCFFRNTGQKPKSFRNQYR